jgi:SAM-dependent methyltransferase
MMIRAQSLKVLARYAAAFVDDYRQFMHKQLPRTCPICDFLGQLVSVSRPPRWNARCPRCDSRERHRLAYLYYAESGILTDTSLAILHFAPEPFMTKLMKHHGQYVTTDPMLDGMTSREDIRALSYAGETFDLVICHHVLEHIDDDRQAMKELRRVLKPTGRAIVSTPINWAREVTFEDPGALDPEQRIAAFGAFDHLRYYGRDFVRRLEDVGFRVETFRKAPEDEVRYGLLRDELLFIATKS